MQSLLSSLLLLLLPHAASAHVKWFVDSAEVEHAIFELNESYAIIGIAFCIVVVIAAVVVSRFIPQPPQRLREWASQHQKTIWHIVNILIGAWLILMSAQGHLLAPSFDVNTTATRVLEMAAIIAGMLLIIGFFSRATAMLLTLLWLSTGIAFGWLPLIETAELAGIAAWLWLTPTHAYATPLLRIATGVSLAVLALDEKLLAPEWSAAFLERYQWNVTASFGLSDPAFILVAGVCELLFALLLMAGLLTRIVTLAVASVMVTTAILLGPAEVVGHLPFFAIGAWLILYGGGERLTLSRSKIKN